MQYRHVQNRHDVSGSPSRPSTFDQRRALHRRRPAAIVVMVALIFGGSLAVGSPVSAHTGGGNATGPEQPHPWPSDKCSYVPSAQSRIFQFSHACQHHDGCYLQQWGSRAQCDSWFLNDMKASCRTGSTRWYARSLCYSIAVVYYIGVRYCGYYSYHRKSVSTPAWYRGRCVMQQVSLAELLR